MSPRAALAAGLLLALSAQACAPSSREDPELAARLEVEGAELAAWLAERSSPADAGERDLVVRLAFGAEGDVDLYVTDPLLETVYFANREARSGGGIAQDVRCDAPAPRLEEVRFADPLPGRYRVGVDHPRRCDGGRDPVAYAVSVAAPGLWYETRGAIGVSVFEVIALEFDVGAPATTP